LSDGGKASVGEDHRGAIGGGWWPIPTALTLGNLACGFLALWALTWPGLPHAQAAWWVGLLVGIGAMLDALDGLAARWLRAASAVGRELDSLADLVTFGVAPAVLVAARQDVSLGWLAGIYTLAAAWRLARFNLATPTRQTKLAGRFVGLPSPAAALGVVSLSLLPIPPLGHLVAATVLAGLMVSHLRYPKRPPRQTPRWLLAGVCLAMVTGLILAPGPTLAIGVAIYLVSPPILRR